MRRKTPETVKALLHDYLRQYGLESPLNEYRLMASWATVVGDVIARHTRSLSIKNQTLIVTLASPTLRTELMMRRSELITKLNQAVGTVVIYDLKMM